MSESAAEPDNDRLPPLFILALGLFAIVVSAAVTLALLVSLQGT
jgi:hypothetical protein